MALLALATEDARNRAIRQESATADAVLSVAISTIDSQLGLWANGLDLLAKSQAALGGDVAGLRDEAATLARKSGSWVTLWQDGPAPREVFSTYWTEDDPHVLYDSLARDHAQVFQHLSAAQPMGISDGYIEPVIGMPTIAISRKLTEGRLAGHWLSLDLTLFNLSRALRNRDLPQSAVVTVVDGAGQVIAGTADAGMTELRPVGDYLAGLIASAPQGTAQGPAQTSDLRGATFAWTRTTAAPAWSVIVSLSPAPIGDVVPSTSLAFAMILLVFLVLLFAYSMHADKRRSDAILRRVERLAERRKAEIEAMARRAHDRQNEEIRRGEKVAMINHDMRTSILGVRSVLDALMHDRPRADQIFRLNSARTASITALRLLDDLQQIDEPDSDTPRVVPDAFSPRQLLTSLPPMIETIAHRNSNRVVIDIPPDLPWLKGDAARIGQIVLNLLGNAAKFTRGGVIRLSARIVKPSDGAEPPRLEVAVADTGKGIAAPDLPNIFRPHFRARPAHGPDVRGSGLGLAIVKTLVDEMEGTIAVDSKTGAGTTFRVSLPLAFAQAPKEKRTDALRGHTVLVVDDDPLLLQITTDQLHRAGARVHMASTRADAVAVCRALRPDVVVLDMTIPGADGFALLRAVRAATNDPMLRAVAWSANMTATRAAECRLAGFSSAAQKDGDIVEVVIHVMQAAASQAPDPTQAGNACDQDSRLLK